MKITLVQVGKTTEKYIETGIAEYAKRLQKYVQLDTKTVAYLKNAAVLSTDELKKQEGAQILKLFSPKDFVILLDESGSSYTSVAFAAQVEKYMVLGNANIFFVIGGAYGFSPAMLERASARVSLSPLTFSHQLVRLVFMEQLYRAFSILNHQPYHHQ